MPKRVDCMFCGAENALASREDVFPLWLGRKLAWMASRKRPDQGLPEYLSHTYTDMADFRADVADDAMGTRATRTAPTGALPAAYKVPVCLTCNNGWMSQLEQSAGRVIPSLLFDGTPKLLTPYEQLVLSTWAVKTALVYDATKPARAIPANAGSRRFYCLGQPMPATYVAVGHDPYHEPEGVLLHGRQFPDYDVPPGVAAARFSFQFDCLLLQVAIYVGTDVLPFGDLRLTEYWAPIWPVEPAFRWPSEAALTKRSG